MKNKLSRLCNKILYIGAVMYVMMANCKTVYAGSLKDSIYVTGTKKMAADALLAIQIIAASVCVVLVAWNLFRMKTSDDNEEPRYKKKAITVVIVVIVIETIGTLMGTVGGYYGVKFS